MSLVPDSIKINTNTWDIKESQPWHPGRGTKASSLVKKKGFEEMNASVHTHLLSLCSAVRQLREVYFLIRVCVFLTNFCPTERKKKSSPQAQVL